jgi:hypothetical protein
VSCGLVVHSPIGFSPSESPFRAPGGPPMSILPGSTDILRRLRERGGLAACSGRRSSGRCGALCSNSVLARAATSRTTRGTCAGSASSPTTPPGTRPGPRPPRSVCGLRCCPATWQTSPTPVWTRWSARSSSARLRPGGRFVFAEHVGAPVGTWVRRGQNLLAAVSRQCQPNRETGPAITRAGFDIVDLHRFDLAGPFGVRVPHITGAAERREGDTP